MENVLLLNRTDGLGSCVSVQKLMVEEMGTTFISYQSKG